MKKKKMKSKQRGLPDDLVVEILSRVPLKSFCRFKCVCKAWLAFSSDPHYRRKLPKIPTGLLYRDQHVQLLSLSANPNDEEIDTIMPDSKKLELVDCCNGLVLCRYRSRRDPSPDTSRLVVYNPATREWRALPVASDPYVPQDTLDMIDADHLTKSSSLDYTTFLGFDPSWSAEFYVFSFQEVLIRSMNAGIMGLEVFDSNMSSCFVDDEWMMGESLVVGRAHIFIRGVLYVETYSDVILVVQGLEEMSHCTEYHSTIKLPDGCEGGGCFGQSSGLLQCAFPEKDGWTITVFSLDAACSWSMRHRLCMRDAFGREDFVHGGWKWPGSCDYRIIALDLEREVILLLDRRPKRLLSYNINTGKLCEIKDGHRLLKSYFTHLNFHLDCHYYVACYSKLPRRAIYVTTTN